MVAAPSTDPTGHEPRAQPPKDKGSMRGGAAKIVASAKRLVSLQIQIWLTQAKAAALKVALFAGLFAAAAVLGILAIIFLYIGVFHVLTDVLHIPVVWAFLIYGGLHLVLALILVLIAVKILTRKDADDEDADTEEPADKGHRHAKEAP